VLGVAGRDRHLGAARALAVADALGDVLGERLGPEADSPRMTSPIASLTTSSKRDMCAPFWRGPEIDEALERGGEELLDAVAR
jgi:hypothetical protein